MVGYEIEKMNALANYMRERGAAIQSKVPLGWPGRVDARKSMEACMVAKTLDETLCNLDTVLEYHAGRMHKMAEATEAGAATGLAMDVANATAVQQAPTR